MPRRQPPPYWPPGMPWWRGCRGGGPGRSPTPTPPPVPPTPPVTIRRLDITLPPSSFVTDARSSYDGAIGGTLASSFIAIPGMNGVTDRYFWWSQTDGTTQQGLDPGNWFAALAGFAGVQVALGTTLVTAQNVALALQAAMAPYPEYTVVQIGSAPTASWQMRVSGPNIDAAGSFTGGDFASRGDAGLWGIRVNQVNTLPFGTFEGPATTANAQHAVAPANAVNRIKAMDVFVGSIHNGGDQFRLALYEGGSGVSPVGANLVHDFGQISGVATDTWVRIWVAPSDVVTVGNATNLWMVLKSSIGTTFVRNVTVASPWEGNMTDQDFYQTTGNPDATVPYEAVVPAGGGFSGFNVTLAMRIVYDSAPFAADGSWLRLFGVHEPVSTAGSEIGINSKLFMGAPVPQVLGMELDSHSSPYGSVHVGQFRAGVYQGPAPRIPANADLIDDLGQTSGGVTEDYVVLLAPGPGVSAVPIDITQTIFWVVKNDSGGGGGNAMVRFTLNVNQDAADPPENPMDWIRASVPPAGDGSEYEAFPTNPNINTDPTSPYEATFVTDGTDTQPGNIPYARLGFRVNGIDLVAS
jgi:hypothetical protein